MIIEKVAETILKPLGFHQKGRSRVWINDRGWHIILVEFQPSSGAQGTYLNVGVCFNNYPRDYFSFDLGGRTTEFIDVKNTDFEGQLKAAVAKAKPLIERYQEGLINGSNYGEFIQNELKKDKLKLKDSGWSNYHVGFAYLLQEVPKFKEYLIKVVKSDDQRPWAQERRQIAATLINHYGPEDIRVLINRSRELRGLSKVMDLF